MIAMADLDNDSVSRIRVGASFRPLLGLCCALTRRCLLTAQFARLAELSNATRLATLLDDHIPQPPPDEVRLWLSLAGGRVATRKVLMATPLQEVLADLKQFAKDYVPILTVRFPCASAAAQSSAMCQCASA